MAKKSIFRYKPSANGRRKPKAKEAEKKMAKVAKDVHFRNIEKKYSGINFVTNLQPNTGDVNSFLNIHSALPLAKGTDSDQRDGRYVQSLYLELNLYVSNTYNRPMHLRIMCLRAKFPTVLHSALLLSLVL